MARKAAGNPGIAAPIIVPSRQLSRHRTTTGTAQQQAPHDSETAEPSDERRPDRGLSTDDFVADAGAPYIHVYANDENGWRGVRSPIKSFRVMDEAQFLRGRHNPQEGGPKGLDIVDEMNVLVVTSECQPLAFFDPAAILEGVAVPGSSDRGRQTLQIRYELEVVGRGWKAVRWVRSITAEARAKVAPVVKGVLSPPRRVTSPERRKS